MPVMIDPLERTSKENFKLLIGRVKEPPISMKCALQQVILLGEDHLVIGKALRCHIQDRLYDNGRLGAKKLEPIGRLAGICTPVELKFLLPNKRLGEYLQPPADKDREQLHRRDVL